MDFCLQVVKEALLISNGDGKNKVSSPLSIAALLNIVAVGSSGRTLQQFHQALGSKTLEDVKSNYSKLAAVSASSGLANGGGDGVCGPLLNFVNGAWVNEIFAVKPSFEHALKSVFNAETKSLDFIIKLDESIDEVNSWVEKATNGLIKSIVGRHNVGCATRMILANALYFKGTWEVKFNSDWTKDREFYLVSGEKVLAPFMRGDRNTRYHYRSFDTFKVVKLPYKNIGYGDDQRQFSMHLFLPNERNGLPELLKEFSNNPSLFLNLNLAVSRVDLEELLIPKFNFSSGFNVSDLMSGLGLGLGELTEMIEDHDGNAANFAGVEILQKACIIVDEEGTEAAAVTYAIGFGSCMIPPKRPSFVADHPFMFMIREDTSGTPFFVGVVQNPLLEK